MKRFKNIAKWVLYIIAIAVSVIYVIDFCANVSALAQSHMDEQFSLIPINFAVFTALVMLVVNKIKPIDKKLFLIPLLFFACSVFTLIVAYNTPCELCG